MRCFEEKHESKMSNRQAFDNWKYFNKAQCSLWRNHHNFFMNNYVMPIEYKSPQYMACHISFSIGFLFKPRLLVGHVNNHDNQTSNKGNVKYASIYQHNKIINICLNLSLTSKINTYHTLNHKTKSITMSTNNKSNILLHFFNNKHQLSTHHTHTNTHNQHLKQTLIIKHQNNIFPLTQHNNSHQIHPSLRMLPLNHYNTTKLSTHGQLTNLRQRG